MYELVICILRGYDDHNVPTTRTNIADGQTVRPSVRPLREPFRDTRSSLHLIVHFQEIFKKSFTSKLV